MKHIIYYLGIFLLLFASCESLEEIYKERDAQDTGYSNNVELELTAEDYELISDLAYDKATTPADSAVAAFIAAHEHFNDTIKAAEFVPPFLADMYPALAYKSSALVTYNYNGEMPEDFKMYTEALAYELIDADYASFDSILNIVKFYSPGYKPEVFIPGVLNEVVAAPEDGDLVLVSYKYATADPTIDFKQIGSIPVITENFAVENSFGTYTAHSVKGDQVWEWASYGGGCGKMTGYESSDKIRYENEDWLVSSEYDLSSFSDVTLSFKHAVNYNDGAWDNVSVYISEDYDGTSSPASSGTWTKLTIPNIPFDESWSFVNSGDIDISAYAGKKVYVGFKYLSSSDIAGTWEVGEVSINVPGVPVAGIAPEKYKDYYTYNEDSGWEKAGDIYFVNAADYDAMGAPGKYNNFSASAKPADYLPNLLSNKYALAGEGYEVVTVYTYYNSAGSGASTLADRYTYTSGVWESSYNFVEPKNDQFLVTNENNWVFDPTISFTMTSDDYQLVVDYVGSNIDETYVDSYGTAEFYTGAGSYYGNYDKREGKWDSDVFDSWEDAVTYSIGNILLPVKYPNAPTQVDGIDMFYIVNFDTYDGADGNYDIKFQVTKAGPNPEFTLVEGPQ